MNSYDWAILGGGLSGIISICAIWNLYPSATVYWIDRDNFNVGDLINYPCVYANTPTDKIKECLQTMYTLLNEECPRILLNNLNDDYITLNLFCDELTSITNIITRKKNIFMHHDNISRITRGNNATGLNIYTLQGHTVKYCACKIVMATGCHHKKLALETPTIPIMDALNACVLSQKKLQKYCIGVFGNSHSGICILKNLVDLGYTNIVCFYTSAIKIPEYKPDGQELYEEQGLRGVSLQWTLCHLMPNTTPITFVDIKSEEYPVYLNNIDFSIYSIGLEPNTLPEMDAYTTSAPPGCQNKYPYCVKSGLLTDNIYGIGSAFPDYYRYNNNLECKIGMIGFMERALEIFRT